MLQTTQQATGFLEGVVMLLRDTDGPRRVLQRVQFTTAANKGQKLGRL